MDFTDGRCTSFHFWRGKVISTVVFISWTKAQTTSRRFTDLMCWGSSLLGQHQSPLKRGCFQRSSSQLLSSSALWGPVRDKSHPSAACTKTVPYKPLSCTGVRSKSALQAETSGARDILFNQYQVWSQNTWPSPNWKTPSWRGQHMPFEQLSLLKSPRTTKIRFLGTYHCKYKTSVYIPAFHSVLFEANVQGHYNQ